MNTSILSGIAHINRCLFRDDFKEELIDLGLEKDLSEELAKGVLEGKGIVDIYQSALLFNEPYKTKITDTLDIYVQNWAKEYDWDFEKGKLNES